MAVVPVAVVPVAAPLLVVVPRPLSDADPGHGECPEASRTCRRCRRAFARHPSVGPEAFPTHWLCPACARPAFGGPSARLRLVGGAGDPLRGQVPLARERAR